MFIRNATVVVCTLLINFQVRILLLLDSNVCNRNCTFSLRPTKFRELTRDIFVYLKEKKVRWYTKFEPAARKIIFYFEQRVFS